MCMCGGVVEVGLAAAIFAWFKRRKARAVALIVGLFVMGLSGCGLITGGLDEPCNRDGTCDSHNLECRTNVFGDSYCKLR